MLYIKSLSQYELSLKSTKLTGLVRLARLKIPTVSNLFIVKPVLFQEFLKEKRLPKVAQKELKKVFFSIRKLGDTVTLRNSVWEKGNSGIAFAVPNTINIKRPSHFENKIIAGFRKVRQVAFDPQSVEFTYLIQSFYSSEKCGLLITQTEKDLMLLQAVLGQHSGVVTREDVSPDTYTIDKSVFKIVSKKIAKKLFKIKKIRAGIKKVKVSKKNQSLPVITDSQAIKIAKLGKILEKKLGPQEIEWAVLDSGKIIFQETRDLKVKKNVIFIKKAQVVYPAKIRAKTINVERLPPQSSLKNKIVITSSLNIAFINQLAFIHQPKAIILTRGSLTSHAVTILREAKITTVLVKNFLAKDNQMVELKKDGSIKIIS